MEKMVEVERGTQDELRQDLKSLFQGAIRVTLEIVLEEELKATVGARRFERIGSRKDHRNWNNRPPCPAPCPTFPWTTSSENQSSLSSTTAR